MCELRPGLIGWSLLNWAFVAKAYQLEVLSPAIVAVAVLESWYVADGLAIEAGNLTMMDIVHDGFGFMLCFGDHAWVPFIYSMKAKFLCYHPQHLPTSYFLLCVGLHFIGYTIFRGANSEKDRFRKNPKDPRVAHLRVLKTASGRSLIISGFWGTCRHPNYVGDWIMTTAWSALTGTSAVLPYFQSIYFAILLIHRQLRDEQQMIRKYGQEDWGRYCKEVPFRLIPYVY
jgi:delta14-sterol reductase